MPSDPGATQPWIAAIVPGSKKPHVQIDGPNRPVESTKK